MSGETMTTAALLKVLDMELAAAAQKHRAADDELRSYQKARSRLRARLHTARAARRTAAVGKKDGGKTKKRKKKGTSRAAAIKRASAKRSKKSAQTDAPAP